MKIFFTCIFFIITHISFSQIELKFEIRSGDRPRLNTPLSVQLEQYHDAIDSELVLYEITESGRKAVPFQIDREYTALLWFVLEGYTPANTQRTFLLTTDGEKETFDQIEIEKSSENIKFHNSGKYILQYNHREVLPPEGVDPVFRRSAFIHPVWSPGQQVLTRIQPPDHYHHYGIWNPWTRTKFQGRQVDFWNLGERQGTVRFKGYITYSEGPVFSGFRALQEHVDFTSAPEETVALNEVLDVRLWNLHAQIPPWLIDFTSILNCATDSSILFFKYRYGGGIGFRATENWGKDNSTVLTSEGKTRDAADASRARWCIIAGETGSAEGQSGILFMSHPQNREHPEPMRMWPSDEQGGKENVFFMFTPIRHKAWTLEPGHNYVLKYRLLVFDGDITAEEAETYWNDFASPPEIKILNKRYYDY